MSRVSGIDQARRHSKARSERLDVAVVAGIQETVDEVHRAGISNIDEMVERRSGRLRRGYQKRVNKGRKSGLVGYLTPASRRRVFYVRFVHDGTAKTRARPFHDTAVLQHEGSHRLRMRKANSSALRLGRVGRKLK